MTAPGVEPLLTLNDPELEWKRFERFCLDLVKALPEVQDAHLYGTRGEDQQGIDIHADLVDGRVRTIQCRRVAKFGKGDAAATIEETTYAADEHEVWATCPMTTGARKLIRETARWGAKDLEQLSSTVRQLPREVARWLVEDHLGQVERRRVLGPDAELVVALARVWFARSDGNPRLLSTNQPLLGRDAELAELQQAVVDPSLACVIVVGRGGAGKTRLLRGIAEELADRRILIVREGVDVGASFGSELPMDPFDLIIDDAHRRPDLSAILATALARDELDTIVLATRPHQVDVVRDSLSALHLRPPAVRVLESLAELSDDAARRLAEHELDEPNQPVATRLGALTRDSPAVTVLAAELIARGEIQAETLIASATLRQEILARYSNERLGHINDSVPADVAARMLSLVAVVQPVDATAPLMTAWLAAQLDQTEDAVGVAVDALVEAELLVEPRHRLRIAPDILGDHLLHEQCVDRYGKPTARVRQLVETVPNELLGRVMANLAELDWRLGLAGEPRILDEACEALGRRLVDADAWVRERQLEQLVSSAPFIADWVMQIARELLDHPARDAALFGDHVVTDSDARRPLVQMVAKAGLDPGSTETAFRLLWQLGRDVEPQTSRSGGDALDEARQLGDYRRPLRYAETLLAVAEALIRDPDEAEGRRHLPLELLSALVAREGTTSEMASRTAIRLGSYVVDAAASRPLRTRLRSLLTESSVTGGERTRPAAAALLGDMLRQPHGYFGRSVPGDQLQQWRSEQLAVIADLSDVLDRGADALVAREIRHAVEWHATHSALYGVKAAVRRLLKANPPSVEERLADALTHSLARFEVHRVGEKRRAVLVRELRREHETVEELLNRVDDAVAQLRRCRPLEHVDVGAILATLASDPEWALAAAQLLMAEPRRPTASGLGVILTRALGERPEAIRSLVVSLAGSEDSAMRRLAADHISRMAWFGDRAAPERGLAPTLAGDDDPVVVQLMLLTALRCADDDPKLASDVLLAVHDLSMPQLAEDACMVLDRSVPLSDAQWERVFDRLLACPRVDYWYDRLLGRRGLIDWRQVLGHLFARIDERPTDYRYDALPFDGVSDFLEAHAPARRVALEGVLDRLAGDTRGRPAMDHPVLFWSVAGDGRDALTVIGRGLAAVEPQRTAAALIVGAAGRHVFLNEAEWVTAHLDASPPGVALDELRGALLGALSSGIKQGTPGQAFPEDVRLEDTARAHAAASEGGSRSQEFWTRVADAAAADMRRQVIEDEVD